MQRIINYGKHAENGTRKINEVTLTISIEPSKYYDPKTKKSYTEGEYFSVCGDVWNGPHTDIIRGGQCVDYIVKRFAHDKTSRNIRALWEVFHLEKMELIPDRFRSAIVEFVNGNSETLEFERKRCAAYLLNVTEHVTDYGIYTNGTLTIKTEDGEAEVITLSQGDEQKSPIVQRAHDAINWLYTDIPSVEDLARTAHTTTNKEEHTAKKEKEREDGLAEIKAIAERIILAIDSGNVGEKWSVARHEMKYAEKFLTEKEGNKQ
jgi:hypothetical protein